MFEFKKKLAQKKEKRLLTIRITQYGYIKNKSNDGNEDLICKKQYILLLS